MFNYRYNLFVLLRTLVGSLAHTEWRRAYARRGVWGLVIAAFEGVTGLNTWPILVRAGETWTPERIGSLLRQYGIRSWGWGYHGGEFYFRVRLRQAEWAQYLLLEEGVPVAGRLLSIPTGDAPWLRRAGRAQGVGKVPSGGEWRGQPQSAPIASRNPLDTIDRVVDRLAGL